MFNDVSSFRLLPNTTTYKAVPGNAVNWKKSSLYLWHVTMTEQKN